MSKNDELLSVATDMLKEKFNIVQSTIQIEHGTSFECHMDPAHKEEEASV
ncbi:MAG: hypothetical protein R3C11_06480 [Planctomycetaceae bacterium]